jgi:hypothetical protein
MSMTARMTPSSCLGKDHPILKNQLIAPCAGTDAGQHVGRGAWRAPGPLRTHPLCRAALLCCALTAAQALQAQTSQPLEGEGSQRYRPVIEAVTPGAAPAALLTGSTAANAQVGQIRVEVIGAGGPADGVTPVLVKVRVLDRLGVPLKAPVMVTIEHSGATLGARLQMAGAPTDEFGPSHKDADRRVPGTQLKLVDGQGSFTLVAPSQPGDVQLRLTAGDATVEGSIEFAPDLREMVAAGLIEGVIGSTRRRYDSAVAPARLEDGFETELKQWSRSFNSGRGQMAGRAAMFLKGKIRGDMLLTMAYDSDKEARARLLRDIKPEEYYPVYGDASVKGFDAKSSAKLFVRIDQQRNYLLFGDFATGEGFAQSSGAGVVAGSKLRQLGAYNRTLTGVRGHVERPDGFGNVFVSRDTLKMVVEEIQANGTSGPFAVSNTQALENSEKVEVVVRDRNNRNTVVSVTQLVRLNDYSFEPFSGRILLNRPLASLDADGNPVSLRISYEVDQGGDAFWLVGGDGQVNLGDKATVGGSLVVDQNPNAPYRLASVNTGIKFGPSTTLVAELAYTEANLAALAIAVPAAAPAASLDTTRGQAGRVEFNHQGSSFSTRAYLNRAGASFANRAAGVQPGTQQGGAGLQVPATEKLTLKAEGQRTEDLDSDARRDGVTVGAEYAILPELTLSGGLRHMIERGRLSGAASSIAANPDPGSYFGSGSGGGFSGAGSTTLINLNNALATTGAAPGTVDDLEATTAFVGAAWKLNPRVTLGAQHEASVDGESRHRSEVGVAMQVAERTKLYARAENQVGLASRYGLDPDARSSVVSFGVDSTYYPGASAFSEYRLRDAADARSAQLASGLRNAWQVDEGVLLHTGAERLKLLSGSGQNATALTTGLDYTGSERWKLGTRLEWRRLDTPASGSSAQVEQDSWLHTVTVARKLDRDWTALLRNYYLATDNHGAKPDGWQDRFQLGLAWRPVDHNRLDALTKYEYKTENNINATEEWRRVHVGALQFNGHPSRPWWWSSRLAAKRVTEQYPNTEGGGRDRYTAWLMGGRLIYDVTENIDLGLQASWLNGRAEGQTGSAWQRSLGVEVGYLLQANLWVSAGYNATGFRDRDLSSDYTARGPFLRLRFKFDADLFAGSDPAINRSLPR